MTRVLARKREQHGCSLVSRLYDIAGDSDVFLLEGGAYGVCAGCCVTRTYRDFVSRTVMVAVVVHTVFYIACNASDVLRLTCFFVCIICAVKESHFNFHPFFFS